MYKCQRCAWYTLEESKHYNVCPSCHNSVDTFLITDSECFFDDPKTEKLYTESNLIDIIHEFVSMDIETFQIVQLRMGNPRISLAGIARILHVTRQDVDYKLKKIIDSFPAFRSVIHIQCRSSIHNKKIKNIPKFGHTIKKIEEIIRCQ